MSTALRLYFTLHITAELPLLGEIDFPETDAGRKLAKRYKKLISSASASASVSVSGNNNNNNNNNNKKSFDENRSTKSRVALKLPPSVIDISSSRTYSSLVLHFREKEDAEEYMDGDPLFLAVPEHPRQLYVKQFWDAEELASLERRLPELVTVDRSNSNRRRDAHATDRRAGSPPGGGGGGDDDGGAKLSVPIKRRRRRLNGNS